jgi:hypothetical protein
MSLTLKQIISAILIVILVVVIGFWGSDTLKTLGEKFEWNLFLTQEEISSQKDARESFSDTISMLSSCIEDTSTNCFCSKSEFGYPTDYSLTIEKKGENSILKLNTPRINLEEREMETSFCFLTQLWSTYPLLLGESNILKLLYGKNEVDVLSNDNSVISPRLFNSSLLFYKLGNKICIVPKDVAKEYEPLSLTCSKKDEIYNSEDSAIEAFDSGLNIASLDNFFAVVAENAGWESNWLKVMKGILFISSYESNKFINNGIEYDSSAQTYSGNNKKGIYMLTSDQILNINSDPNIINHEFNEYINEQGYGDVELTNDMISSLLINDNTFSARIGFIYFTNVLMDANKIGELNTVQSTKDIFNIWLRYYHGKNISYNTYLEKINVLNDYAKFIGVGKSEVLEESNSPHRIQ